MGSGIPRELAKWLELTFMSESKPDFDALRGELLHDSCNSLRLVVVIQRQPIPAAEKVA